MIVFCAYACMQITYNKSSHKVYLRTYSKGGSNTWSEWKELSFA